MKVFIVKDEDTGDCHAFKNRENAIDMMYRRCKDWGASLDVAVNINGIYQYTSLDKVCYTDEQKLDFLYHCLATELCDVFEAYWSFQECEFEDEEG